MSVDGEYSNTAELVDFAGRSDIESGSSHPNSGEDKGLKRSDITGEWHNIILLLLLYTLQGVPMGISAVFPLILKERGASFSDLGTFSLNSWPFSLKLLWAPVVDAAYFNKIGRRKTWLVPAQLLIGFVMMGLSTVLDTLLYVEEPAIKSLTGMFFLLYFLCATQDIAVDGWALTMLRKENVGYAATCNSAGQTLGYALGFTGFMVFEQLKIASLSSFMFFWGIVFVFTTLAIAILKNEKAVPPEDEPDDVATAYKQMLDMTRLRSVRSLVLVLFTWKAGFAVEGALVAKFQEYGVPKEHLAYLTTMVMPVYILLPLLVANWTAGATPFDLALKAYPFRLLLFPCFALLACLTPSVLTPVPLCFYASLLCLSVVAAVANQCMFVSQMALFAQISDPAMGGTYMTLLNTLANLGGMWPSTVAMFLIDITTCKSETCVFPRDGFFIVTTLCFVIGATWFCVGAGFARHLQHQKQSSWKVR